MNEVNGTRLITLITSSFTYSPRSAGPRGQRPVDEGMKRAE